MTNNTKCVIIRVYQRGTKLNFMSRKAERECSIMAVYEVNENGERITKAMRFAELRAMAESADRADLVSFIDREVELLSRKKSSKKENPEREKKIAVIMDCLAKADKPMRVSEILAEFNLNPLEYSNALVSNILNSAVKDGTVVKTSEKKKSYFSLADNEEG